MRGETVSLFPLRGFLSRPSRPRTHSLAPVPIYIRGPAIFKPRGTDRTEILDTQEHIGRKENLLRTSTAANRGSAYDSRVFVRSEGARFLLPGDRLRRPATIVAMVTGMKAHAPQ